MSIRDDVEEIARIDAEMEQLKEQRAERVENIVANMESDILELEGVGRIERTWSKPRTEVDREGLVSAVNRLAAGRCVDEDGHIVGDIAAAKVEMYGEMFRFEPRWGALKKVGIKDDEYCKAGKSKPGIRIHPVGVIK